MNATNTNKQKHTPGPWAINGTEQIPDLTDTGTLRHAVIRSEGERWTALVEIEDKEGEANARLIAAAPELLEALQMIVARIDYYSALPSEQRPGIEQWEYTQGSSDMAVARMAIRKACALSQSACQPDVFAQTINALRKDVARIDQLCDMVNNLANQLGLGKKVNAADWNDEARTALARATGGNP